MEAYKSNYTESYTEKKKHAIFLHILPCSIRLYPLHKHRMTHWCTSCHMPVEHEWQSEEMKLCSRDSIFQKTENSLKKSLNTRVFFIFPTSYAQLLIHFPPVHIPFTSNFLFKNLLMASKIQHLRLWSCERSFTIFLRFHHLYIEDIECFLHE